MSQSEKLNLRPTHACLVCGEWFEVESAGWDSWIVSPCDNEGVLAVQAWAEAATTPVCPFDSSTLGEFLITES